MTPYEPTNPECRSTFPSSDWWSQRPAPRIVVPPCGCRTNFHLGYEGRRIATTTPYSAGRNPGRENLNAIAGGDDVLGAMVAIGVRYARRCGKSILAMTANLAPCRRDHYRSKELLVNHTTNVMRSLGKALIPLTLYPFRAILPLDEVLPLAEAAS